jgi:hypothetical protein
MKWDRMRFCAGKEAGRSLVDLNQWMDMVGRTG